MALPAEIINYYCPRTKQDRADISMEMVSGVYRKNDGNIQLLFASI
jgi:hypothetical protein